MAETVSEEEVSLVASAMYGRRNTRPFDDAPEYAKHRYRYLARVAIAALSSRRPPDSDVGTEGLKGTGVEFKDGLRGNPAQNGPVACRETTLTPRRPDPAVDRAAIIEEVISRVEEVNGWKRENTGGNSLWYPDELVDFLRALAKHAAKP